MQTAKIWVLVFVSLASSSSSPPNLEWLSPTYSSSDPHDTDQKVGFWETSHNSGLKILLGFSFSTGEATGPGCSLSIMMCQPGGGVRWTKWNHSFYLSNVVLLYLYSPVLPPVSKIFTVVFSMDTCKLVLWGRLKSGMVYVAILILLPSPSMCWKQQWSPDLQKLPSLLGSQSWLQKKDIIRKEVEKSRFEFEVAS